MSVREIERIRHISHHTVKKGCDRARGKGLAWDRARLMCEDEVARLLFPEEAEAADAMGRSPSATRPSRVSMAATSRPETSPTTSSTGRER